MKKNAIITGCNRGTGEGIRDVLIQSGNFHVTGLNRTKAKDIENSLLYDELSVDLNNPIDESILKDLPKKIDLLVLNAGIRKFGNVGELSMSDWNQSVNINLTSLFNTVSLLKERIVESKGDIVIVGSHSEKYSFEGGAAYCSTKLAIKGLANCLVDELRYHDVRVSYLSIGSIKNRDHGYDEEWKLEPKDIGKTILGIVELPKKVLIPYIDVRPIKPLKDTLSGMERLQYV